MTARYWFGIVVFSLHPMPRRLARAAARLLISAIFALAVNILADLIHGDYPLQEKRQPLQLSATRELPLELTLPKLFPAAE